MRITGKISLRIKVTLFAFTLLYLLAAVLSVYPKNQTARHLKQEPKSGITYQAPENKHQVYLNAAAVSASFLYITAEIYPLLQRAVFVPVILVFSLIFKRLYYCLSFVGFRSRYLFRVLPNAP